VLLIRRAGRWPAGLVRGAHAVIQSPPRARPVHPGGGISGPGGAYRWGEWAARLTRAGWCRWYAPAAKVWFSPGNDFAGN